MVTPVQHKVYHYVKEYIAKHGFSPSLTEIAVGIGISASSISLISRSIHALVAAGRLRFHKKGYRNIEVIEDNKFSLPFMKPMQDVIANPRQNNVIDLSFLFKNPDYFVVEMKHDFMINAGIFRGDLVVCKSTNKANEQDIVAVLIDSDEPVLQRLSYKIKDRVTLIPANQTLKPKAYLPHRVHIQGVMVGLLRFNAQE